VTGFEKDGYALAKTYDMTLVAATPGTRTQASPIFFKAGLKPTDKTGYNGGNRAFAHVAAVCMYRESDSDNKISGNDAATTRGHWGNEVLVRFCRHETHPQVGLQGSDQNFGENGENAFLLEKKHLEDGDALWRFEDGAVINGRTTWRCADWTQEHPHTSDNCQDDNIGATTTCLTAFANGTVLALECFDRNVTVANGDPNAGIYASTHFRKPLDAENGCNLYGQDRDTCCMYNDGRTSYFGQPCGYTSTDGGACDLKSLLQAGSWMLDDCKMLPSALGVTQHWEWTPGEAGQESFGREGYSGRKLKNSFGKCLAISYNLPSGSPFKIITRDCDATKDPAQMNGETNDVNWQWASIAHHGTPNAVDLLTEHQSSLPDLLEENKIGYQQYEAELNEAGVEIWDPNALRGFSTKASANSASWTIPEGFLSKLGSRRPPTTEMQTFLTLAKTKLVIGDLPTLYVEGRFERLAPRCSH
jgi:hypothetical protein